MDKAWNETTETFFGCDLDLHLIALIWFVEVLRFVGIFNRPSVGWACRKKTVNHSFSSDWVASLGADKTREEESYKFN